MPSDQRRRFFHVAMAFQGVGSSAFDSPQRPVLRDSLRRAISCEVEDTESCATKTWLTCVKDFDISKARLMRFTHDACTCRSFRKQDKILWTTPCVILHKAQEHRPTRHGARRCGNRISYVPPWPIDPVAVDDVDRRALLRPRSRPTGRGGRKLILPTCCLCLVLAAAACPRKRDKHILFVDVQ